MFQSKAMLFRGSTFVCFLVPGSPLHLSPRRSHFSVFSSSAPVPPEQRLTWMLHEPLSGSRGASPSVN